MKKLTPKPKLRHTANSVTVSAVRKRRQKHPPLSPEARARQLAPLRHFQAGESGNPHGTSRVWTIRRIIEYVGMELKEFDDVRGKPEEITKLEYLVRKLFAMGFNGDMTAIRILLERYEGKPAEIVQVQTQGHQFISTSYADALSIIDECSVRLRRYVSSGIEDDGVEVEAGLRSMAPSATRVAI
jgi:hypothetical protein